MVKKISLLLFLSLLFLNHSFFAQGSTQRLIEIEKRLDSLSPTVPGLNQTVDFSLSDTQLPIFLRTIAKQHKLNLSIGSNLMQIKVSQNFTNARVKNVLLYVCKEFDLTIEVFGSIISIKRYVKPYEPRDLAIKYDSIKDAFSIDLKNDTLYLAFKQITKQTGKNLVFAPGLENQKLSAFIQQRPFESALDKIAFANNLIVTKTKDNYYLFERGEEISLNRLSDKRRQKPARYKNKNFYFKVLDTVKQVLDVDFQNTSIASVIEDVGYDLNISMFTTSPLADAGLATVKANDITFEMLLSRMLENTKFSYKKRDGVFYFGQNDKPSLLSTETIPLVHRSIQMMTTPIQSSQNSAFGIPGTTGMDGFIGNQNGINPNGFNRQGGNFTRQTNVNPANNQNRNAFQDFLDPSEALLELIPEKTREGLKITTDFERNSFVVYGNAQKIEEFKKVLKTIDKPVPVILIEVMIIEVTNSSSVSTGLGLGLADGPTNDSGTVFPNTNVTLGAQSINKIIGGFNGFGSLNVGKVVPNFYAQIEALETNGDLKIKSTPKLSTLNGHMATLSRGERSFYAVTQRNTIGTQNPVVSDVKNFFPIDANLSIGIRPMVSGDNNITLSINVLQSDFNGQRIEPEAPPGMNSREFTSTIRVKDKDVIILGGIEENSNNETGSGVPFLARVPIIKWLFSKRVRTAQKSKLSVLIKPTIIQ